MSVASPPAASRYGSGVPHAPGKDADLAQLGAFVGCLFAFAFGDRLGRRWTIFVGVTCNWVGAVLQISSFQLPQMIVGRLINGFGMGETTRTDYSTRPLTSSRRDILHLSSLSSRSLALPRSRKARRPGKRVQHRRRVSLDLDELRTLRQNRSLPMALPLGLPARLPGHRSSMLSIRLRLATMAAAPRPTPGSLVRSSETAQPGRSRQ